MFVGIHINNSLLSLLLAACLASPEVGSPLRIFVNESKRNHFLHTYDRYNAKRKNGIPAHTYTLKHLCRYVRTRMSHPGGLGRPVISERVTFEATVCEFLVKE